MEKRITDRDNAVNNSFGYINSKTGQFVARDLKQYLTEKGIYSEQPENRAIVTSKDLTALYTTLKNMVENEKGKDLTQLYSLIQEIIAGEKTTLLDNYYQKLKDKINSL